MTLRYLILPSVKYVQRSRDYKLKKFFLQKLSHAPMLVVYENKVKKYSFKR